MKQNKQTDGCALAGVCGGCALQGMPYPQQLEAKQQYVEGLLGEFGKVQPVKGMKDPYHYRNKAQFAFGYDYNSNIIAGNYVPGSQRIIDLEECVLVPEVMLKIVDVIKKFMTRNHIGVYQQRSGSGVMRHVMIRHSYSNGDLMVVLVTGRPSFYGKEALVKELTQRFKKIKTILLSVNREHTSKVLGSGVMTLYGPGWIEDELLGKKFRISPASFYQVNSLQTELLYSTAIKAAEFRGEETVLDAYCGIGTIGICMSPEVKQVYGVELNPQAVRDAGFNIQLNGIENVSVTAQDAGKFMQQVQKDGKAFDAVIMDPPRAGSDQKFLNALLQMAPQKIVYISCNPVTLQRDLRFLTHSSYKVKSIQPVDMFPFTDHIETIVLLCRK